MLRGLTECYTVLQGVTWFNRVLHGFTGCYTVFHGVTRCYRVLHGFRGCYTVLHCAKIPFLGPYLLR